MAPVVGPGEIAEDQSQEILDAGQVELTGVIHPHSSSYRVWLRLAARRSSMNPSHFCWPEETGGPEVLLKVLEVAESASSMRDSFHEIEISGFPVYEFHPEIHALIQPERQRQKKLMQEAIRRVIRMLHS